MKPRLLFATTNAGKLKELRGLVGDAVEVVSREDLPPVQGGHALSEAVHALAAAVMGLKSSLHSDSPDNGEIIAHAFPRHKARAKHRQRPLWPNRLRLCHGAAPASRGKVAPPGEE